MAFPTVLEALRRLLGAKPAPPRPDLIFPGARVALRNPLASSHRVWIPAGACGIVVGWNRPRRQVSIELDSPRTVVTVPWSWVEEESPRPPATASDASPETPGGPT